MSYLDHLQLQNACRLCLSNNSNNIDIFGEEGRSEAYQDKIWKHFSLWVCFEDTLPRTICQLCCTLIDKYHTFVLKVEEIQKIITQMVSSRSNNVNNVVACETHSGCKRDPHFQLCNLSEKEDLKESFKNIDQSDEPVDTNIINTFNKHPSQEVTVSNSHNPTPLVSADREQIVDNIKDEDPLQVINYDMTCNTNLAQSFNCESNRRISSELKSIRDDPNCETSEEVNNISVSESLHKSIDCESNDTNVTHISQLKRNCDGEDNNSRILAEKGTDFNKNLHCELVSTKFQNNFKNVISCRESENERIEEVDENQSDLGCSVSEDENESRTQSDEVLHELSLNGQLAAFYEFNCKICGCDTAKFPSFFLLCKHYRLKHDARGYVTCCGRMLLSKSLLVSHMQKHVQPGIYKCEQCGKELANERTYERHMFLHLPDDKRPFKCKHCARGFSYKGSLQSHETVHLTDADKLVHACDTCGKKFVSPAQVFRHQKYVHEKLRKVMCHICAKTFPKLSVLKEHLNSHDKNIEGIQCHLCGKRLKNKRTLKKHVKYHRSKLLECPHCDKKVRSAASLRSHLLIHSDERPHRCLVCDKTFRRKQDVKTHTVQHTGEMPYKCPHCFRSFASSGNYYTHKKRMHSRENSTVP